MDLPHIIHTIIYTTNGTALENKRKSNDAQHLVTGVQQQKEHPMVAHLVGTF